DIVCSLVVYDDFLQTHILTRLMNEHHPGMIRVYYRVINRISGKLREIGFTMFLLILFPKFRLLLLGRDIGQPSTVTSTLLRRSTS
ncbi:hypothetical protein PENTCL1PPCAC_4522, partial [Pristionchus entomophagus]